VSKDDPHRPRLPRGRRLPGEVETKIQSIPEVRTADVELVWDPPWDRSRMSEGRCCRWGCSPRDQCVVRVQKRRTGRLCLLTHRTTNSE
jgi:metal-sulfur cluster biosynthetic enzyme